MNEINMKVAILGANGRMGRVLIEALRENEEADLAVATVRDDSPWVGIDVGELAGIGTQGVSCSAVSTLNPDDVDVVIDFTLPAAFDDNLAWCVANKKPVVIGTTGLSEQQLIALDEAAKQIPLVFAANYSVGVNVMLALVKQAALVLGNTADIEILEAHHGRRCQEDSFTHDSLRDVRADQ